MIWQEISAAETFLCRSRIYHGSHLESMNLEIVLFNQEFIKG